MRVNDFWAKDFLRDRHDNSGIDKLDKQTGTLPLIYSDQDAVL